MAHELVDITARTDVANLAGRFEGQQLLLEDIRDRVTAVDTKIDRLPEMLLTREETLLHLKNAELIHNDLYLRIEQLRQPALAPKPSIVEKSRMAFKDLPKVKRVGLLLAIIGAATVIAGAASAEGLVADKARIIVQAILHALLGI